MAVGTLALGVLVAGCFYARDAVALKVVMLVMAIFTAAAAAMAAILAGICARLTGDARSGWLSGVLGIYSLVAVPAATINILAVAWPGWVRAIQFLAHCAVAALLIVATVAPQTVEGWRGAGLLVGTTAVTAATAFIGLAVPNVLVTVTGWPPLRLAVGVVWVGAAIMLSALLARRHAWALWYVLGGIAIIGAAHSALVALASSAVTDLGLAFSTVRLAATVLVLGGVARLAHDALARRDVDFEQQEEELRLAQIRLDRTAERDHELRTGLAGLIGATRIMGAEAPDTETTTLGSALASELSRLDDLLQTSTNFCRNGSTTSSYALAPVFAGLVALRRSSGMDVRLDIEPGLRTQGSSEMLAEVITNLLDNAAQHAPGSPLRISALQESGHVVVRVRDFGPGVPAGQEAAVFDRGVRDRWSRGSGLGLHICRDLLAADGGTISIRRSTPDCPGCTVVIRLPSPVTSGVTDRLLSRLSSAAS
ncbi:sensor histidine kinase [Pseudonocardia adelaidensis]|uniref:histidine kinase n=1 Tax=Pseudonocardia adelaidensis TaxID=648754 RepID=A0ABP9N8V6_9PSEU